MERTGSLSTVSESPNGAPSKTRSHLLAIAGFFGVFSIACIPVFLDVSTHAVGDRFNDVWPGVWHIWWIKEHFWEIATFDFFTDKMFYPLGIEHHYHIPVGLGEYIALPFLWFFDPVTSWNLSVYLTLILNGVSMYFLGHYFTRDSFAAFVSGLVFSFSAYAMGQIHNGSLDNVNMFFLPLFFLFFAKALSGGGKRHVVLASLFLFLATLSSYYYGFYLVIFAVLYALLSLFGRSGSVGWKQIIRRSLSVLVLYLLCISPFFLLLFSKTAYHKSQHMIYISQVQFIVDVMDYFWPGKMRVGDVSRLFLNTTYIGFTCLLLVVLSFMGEHKKRIRRLGAICAVFLVLALGVHLSVFGRVFFEFFLPSRLLPAVNTYRAFSVALMVLAVLSGHGVLYFLGRFKNAKLKMVLFFVIPAVLLAEVALISPAPYPWRKTRMVTHPVYEKLGEMEEDFAIIELPFDFFNHQMCGRYLYHQVTHGKKLPYGPSYFTPIERQNQHWSYIKDNRFLDLVIFGSREHGGLYEETLRRDFQEARKDGFRFIIVHKKYVVGHRGEALMRLLDGLCSGMPYSDEEIALYEM